LRIVVPFLILMALLAPASPRHAEAGQVAIAIQGVRAKPYDDAFNGFTAAIGPNVTVRRLVLSDDDSGNLTEATRSIKPDLIYAIGMQAVSELNDIAPEVPLVYAMVPDIAAVHGRKHATGVSMFVEPAIQIAIIMEALPRIKSVGLLYDPERTGGAVDAIRKAAAAKGISVLAREVWRQKSIPLMGMEIMENIDLFWMIPDLTVVTPETAEFLFLFAMESETPVLAFSDKYADIGALVTIGVDPSDIGRQAGEMARKVLAGGGADTVPPEHARKANVTVNLKIARKLGIMIDRKFMEQTVVIE